MVHAVIERIQPGDVLLLTMPEPSAVALLGELLATRVKVKGAAAILVDGAIRDFEELLKLGLPIWTRYIRVRGATKTRMGQLDVPVTVGGTSIAPGDSSCSTQMAACASNASGRQMCSKPPRADRSYQSACL